MVSVHRSLWNSFGVKVGRFLLLTQEPYINLSSLAQEHLLQGF